MNLGKMNEILVESYSYNLKTAKKTLLILIIELKNNCLMFFFLIF